MNPIMSLVHVVVSIFIIYLLAIGLGWWMIPFVLFYSFVVHLIKCLDPDSGVKTARELNPSVRILLVVFDVYSWAIVYWIIFQENLFLKFYNGVAVILS